MTESEPAETGDNFVTPEQHAREQTRRLESPRGPLMIASCQSGAYLASQVFNQYQEILLRLGAAQDGIYLESVDGQFSDGETVVRLEQDPGGFDVYLFQTLFDPKSGGCVDHNYLAFFIAARAFREWGANYVTAVLPYLAYARQDKSTHFEREPAAANLLADLSIEAGIDRMVTWHPHSPQVQGFYDQVPVVRLEPHSFFVEAFRQFAGREDAILVAPDAGASGFVTRIARELRLNAAIASKYRPRHEEAVIHEVIGDFHGKTVAIILDDMISSGGTVYALVQELVANKGIGEVFLGVSHNLCLDLAGERLEDLHANYGLRQLVVTNTISQTEAFRALPYLTEYDLSPVFSRVINRIHYNRPFANPPAFPP
jgi:ribose-phosphate pyrophosphokinase